uniref:Taste receptor type 2 n=1 Tax=Ditylenchus dipsaci TaxID=166011 RepID=A0A915DRU3_9BILA
MAEGCVILLQTCINNLYNLIISVIVQPIFLIDDGRSIMFQNGVLRNLPATVGCISYLVWWIGFNFNIFSCLSSLPTVILCFAAVCFFLALNGFLLFNGSYPTALYDKLFHNSSSFHLLKEANTEDVMLSLNGQISSLENQLAYAFLLVINSVCYTFIGWSSLQIWIFMSKMSTSANLKSINKQLTVTLLTQAALPACLLFILTFCFITLLFVVESKSTMFFMTFMTVPINWIPALSPVLTISFIQPYRNFCLTLIGRIFRKKTRKTSSTISFVRHT